MPYIPENSRKLYDPSIDKLIERLDGSEWNPGDLTYIIYRLMLAAYRRKPAFATVNALLGTLSAVGKEFYRRIGRPHETEAIRRNGDVC
jgi:hypothetical protein